VGAGNTFGHGDQWWWLLVSNRVVGWRARLADVARVGLAVVGSSGCVAVGLFVLVAGVPVYLIVRRYDSGCPLSARPSTLWCQPEDRAQPVLLRRKRQPTNSVDRHWSCARGVEESAARLHGLDHQTESPQGLADSRRCGDPGPAVRDRGQQRVRGSRELGAVRLTDNQRQRDPVDGQALAELRAGDPGARSTSSKARTGSAVIADARTRTRLLSMTGSPAALEHQYAVPRP
jgi:hypothetical protein